MVRMAMRLAQFVNRKVLVSQKLKACVPFRECLFHALTPPLDDSEVARLAKEFKTDIVSECVRKLIASGNPNIDFYVLLVRSMGDIMACEPITRYLKGIAPQCRIHWILFSRYRGAVETNPLIDEIIEVKSLSEGKDLCSRMAGCRGNVVVDCTYDATTCSVTNRTFPNRNNPSVNPNTYYSIGNLLETFCLTAGMPKLDESPSYNIDGILMPDVIPNRKYIVIHCHSSSKVRDWPECDWSRLARCLANNGYSVVEVGIEKGVRESFDGYVDYTGSRAISSIVKAIDGASLFIGGDSCFAHAANCRQTPSVILLGKYFIYDNHFPYSGSFARSDFFKIVRAPKGKFVKDIPFDQVRSSVDDMLKRVEHGVDVQRINQF